MKIAAAYVIDKLVSEDELRPEHVIAQALELRIALKVACYVAKAAIQTGVARRKDVTPEMDEEYTKELLAKGDERIDNR